MKPSLAALAAAALLAAGCQKASPPAAVVPQVQTLPKASAPRVPAPVMPVALVEPYLVAVELPHHPAIPAPLGGRVFSGPITPLPEPAAPLAPAPPTRTVPILPRPAPQAPAKPKTTIPPAVVRLLEEERSRSVDDARQRLAAATTRATQTAAEARKQWGYVKEGFVAQKQAENADAAARDAAAEQSEAQKALDDAQRRQRDARRDLQAAYSAIADAGFRSAALEKSLPAYRPIPYTYRLSILGVPPKDLTVENGTLGRSLPHTQGEGGAWIVRCTDPSRLRVKVGARECGMVLHSLPSAEAPVRGAA